MFNNGSWSYLQTTGIYTTGTTGLIDNTLCLGYSGTFMSNRYICLSARLNQTFDLTSYKYLKITFDSVRHVGISGTAPTSVMVGISNTAFSNTIATSNSGYVYPDGTIAKTLGQRGNIIILDISSVSGAYYIYFGTTIFDKTVGYCGVTQILLSNS